MAPYLTNYWSMSNLCDGVGGTNLNGGSSYSFSTDRFNNSNTAIYFDNGFLQAPAGTYFSGDFTITAWFYLLSYQNPGVCCPQILDFGNGAFTNNVMLGFQQNLLRFAIVVGGSFNQLWSSVQINLNTWYHVAAVMKGSTGYIYLNGVLSSYGTLPTPENVYRKRNLIGWDNFFDSQSKAIYDEIKIYNIAFSPTNISLDMSIGADNSK